MFSNRTLLGKLLRLPFRLIPKNSILPIVFGILVGKRWIFGSGVAGYALGIYEQEEQRLLARLIKKNQVFFDVGANVGFYSLLAAELVGAQGIVVSFEPDVTNFDFLKRHLEINQIKNVRPFEFAVSDLGGEVYFQKGENNAIGRLVDNTKGVAVRAVSLDEFCAAQNIYPDFIKIDVEGAEFKVLNGVKSILSKNHPNLVVATHSDQLFIECRDFLWGLGYDLEEVPMGMQENRDIIAVFKR